MVVQACMHVVIMVNSNAIYNDDVSVAMIHVLPNNFGLSSCWQNVSLFLLPVACFMEDIWYALSGGSAVCVPIRWSPFSGMLHGISTVFCTTHHTIMTIWIRQQTVDLRSMYLTAVCLCVPCLLCPRDMPWIINCGLLRCGLLSPDGFTLPWIINCGLPRCRLLSPDEFSLCHALSTVDYLAMVYFLVMDSLSAIIIINCILPYYGVLSNDGFTVSHGLSAIIYYGMETSCCSVHGLSAVYYINHGEPTIRKLICMR